MKCLSVLFALALSSPYANSTGLVTKMTELADLVSDVQVGKNSVRQKVSFAKEMPFRMQLLITEVDPKGKETNFENRINLALLDPNLVGWEEVRDRLQVNLRSGGQPIVKKLRNGELNGYQKEATVFAIDIDNAREIEKLLKEIIPLALVTWETSRAIPETYEDLKTWLQAHVKDVVVGEDVFQQQWDFDQVHPSRCATTQTIIKGSQKTSRRYQWNLADIYFPSVAVNIKSKDVTVHMDIKNMDDFIRVEEEGILKNYENEVLIYMAEVDEAHAMSFALRKLVPLAEKVQKEYLPWLETKEAAIDSLRKSLINLRQGEDDLRQTIEGGCEGEYVLSKENSKGNINYSYQFNYSDFLANTVELNVKGTKIEVQMNTGGGNKFVYLKENGEQQNYSNFVTFPAPDIPTGRLMQHYLLQVIARCSSETSPGAFEDLQKIVSEIEFGREELEQSLELIDNDPCKCSLLIKETNIKKDKEEQFDFNLYDLDSTGIDISVKGKFVTLFVPTKGNNEIIKFYTDGEKTGFVKDFSINVRDIPSAKLALSTLKSLVNTCDAK